MQQANKSNENFYYYMVIDAGLSILKTTVHVLVQPSDANLHRSVAATSLPLTNINIFRVYRYD